MQNDILRKVQMVQLELALEVKRICEKICVDYWLDAGTLLGAVRHKGFIPWDDDLDVGMLRSDYNRFLQEAPNMIDNRYFLQTIETDQQYGLVYAKIRKKNTKFVEAVAPVEMKNNGIFIDIIPYDYYPEVKRKQVALKKKLYFLKRLLLVKSGYRPWLATSNRKGKQVVKSILYFPINIIASFSTKEAIISKINEIIPQKKTNYVFPQDGATDCGEIVIPAQIVENLLPMVFENNWFNCPKDFEKYLSLVYGDYLQLPPVEERYNRHAAIEIEL